MNYFDGTVGAAAGGWATAAKQGIHSSCRVWAVCSCGVSGRVDIVSGCAAPKCNSVRVNSVHGVSFGRHTVLAGNTHKLGGVP